MVVWRSNMWLDMESLSPTVHKWFQDRRILISLLFYSQLLGTGLQDFTEMVLCSGQWVSCLSFSTNQWYDWYIHTISVRRKDVSWIVGLLSHNTLLVHLDLLVDHMSVWDQMLRKRSPWMFSYHDSSTVF